MDVTVIGGGPGGYVAALRAAQLGLKVALVEREQLGGTCLNWGCIPTKTLLHGADLLRELRQAAELGIEVQGLSFDLGRMVARSRAVADRLQRGVRHLLAKAGVQVLAGAGRLDGPGRVAVALQDGTQQLVSARHVVLATGARPRELPGLAFDGDRVWQYRQALQPGALPKSLLVIGAGAIGMEFASFYAALGTQVCVVEAQPRVLPECDEEVSAFVQAASAKDGIRVLVGHRVESAQRSDTGVRVVVARAGKRETLQAERVLVAIGVLPNTEGLGLPATRAELARDHLVTDAWGATAEPGLWAIGDLAAGPKLAHKASHDAVRCIERIAGLRDQDHGEHATIPACTYGHPQTAAIGLTQQQATVRGHELRIGKFSLAGNGKALAIAAANGFVKTIFDAGSGALLGAHIVGPNASELIHGLALATTLETTEAELIATVFPHPTLSEAVHESVLAAFGRAIHA